MKILVLYFSKTGHTLEAANATVEGIRSAGCEADLVAVSDFRASTVTDYEGLIFGSRVGQAVSRLGVWLSQFSAPWTRCHRIA